MADMSIQMSPAQIDAFLAEPRHAIVGVIRSDGAPQLSPVWILCEDDRIYFSVLVDSAKFRQLERDPRISLCIDAGHPDARAVMIRGRVKIIRETSAWSEDLSWRINRRYHASEDETRQYMELIATQGASALVAVSPERLIGRNFN